VSRVRRHALVLLAALAVVTGAAGVAVAKTPAHLSAHGPTRVSGTDATAVFRIADRTIRQVRYRDHGVLVYTFRLRNDASLPVTVTGTAPLAHEPRLFDYLTLTDRRGASRFTLGAGNSTVVQLRMRMHGCETLSARAGSFATEVVLRTTRAHMWHDVVPVQLPEEVHTGSPREAFCPNSTATSRPPG
jgi:hypothetical protein